MLCCAQPCQIFLTTQATECWWETCVNIFKHAQLTLFKLVHLVTHMLIQMVMHAYGVVLQGIPDVSFRWRVERDGGIDRRDDWSCCFPPVRGKSDCMKGKRGGEFHVPNCSMKPTNTTTFSVIVSECVRVCVSCAEVLRWWPDVGFI